MKIKNKIFFLAIIMIISISLYLFYSLGSDKEYAFNKRIYKVWAMIVVSSCIAFSSISFQTLTVNKILTPAIMGFEAVFLLFQTCLVFFYGNKTFTVISSKGNFIISLLFMMFFAWILYVFVLKKEKNNLYLLLLIGLILNSLLSSISSFMQLIIDPSEFAIVEGKMFASFNKININLLFFSSILMILTFIYGFKNIRELDVFSLGRENAINLGINYHQVMKKHLFIISILVSVSTALIGPITFLGILVTSLTYQLFKTYKHRILIPACCLISCISIILGQFLVEHVFNFSTTLSVIVNFIGGVYFMFLLLKMNKI